MRGFGKGLLSLGSDHWLWNTIAVVALLDITRYQTQETRRLETRVSWLEGRDPPTDEISTGMITYLNMYKDRVWHRLFTSSRHRKVGKEGVVDDKE